MAENWELIDQKTIIKNLRAKLLEENKGAQVVGFFPDKNDLTVIRVVDKTTYKATDYISVSIDGTIKETTAPIKDKTVVSQYANLDSKYWVLSEKYGECSNLTSSQKAKRPKKKASDLYGG